MSNKFPLTSSNRIDSAISSKNTINQNIANKSKNNKPNNIQSKLNLFESNNSSELNTKNDNKNTNMNNPNTINNLTTNHNLDSNDKELNKNLNIIKNMNKVLTTTNRNLLDEENQDIGFKESFNSKTSGRKFIQNSPIIYDNNLNKNNVINANKGNNLNNVINMNNDINLNNLEDELPAIADYNSIPYNKLNKIDYYGYYNKTDYIFDNYDAEKNNKEDNKNFFDMVDNIDDEKFYKMNNFIDKADRNTANAVFRPLFSIENDKLVVAAEIKHPRVLTEKGELKKLPICCTDLGYFLPCEKFLHSEIDHFGIAVSVYFRTLKTLFFSFLLIGVMSCILMMNNFSAFPSFFSISYFPNLKEFIFRSSIGSISPQFFRCLKIDYYFLTQNDYFLFPLDCGELNITDVVDVGMHKNYLLNKLNDDMCLNTMNKTDLYDYNLDRVNLNIDDSCNLKKLLQPLITNQCLNKTDCNLVVYSSKFKDQCHPNEVKSGITEISSSLLGIDSSNIVVSWELEQLVGSSDASNPARLLTHDDDNLNNNKINLNLSNIKSDSNSNIRYLQESTTPDLTKTYIPEYLNYIYLSYKCSNKTDIEFFSSTITRNSYQTFLTLIDIISIQIIFLIILSILHYQNRVFALFKSKFYHLNDYTVHIKNLKLNGKRHLIEINNFLEHLYNIMIRDLNKNEEKIEKTKPHENPQNKMDLLLYELNYSWASSKKLSIINEKMKYVNLHSDTLLKYEYAKRVNYEHEYYPLELKMKKYKGEVLKSQYQLKFMKEDEINTIDDLFLTFTEKKHATRMINYYKRNAFSRFCIRYFCCAGNTINHLYYNNKWLDVDESTPEVNTINWVNMTYSSNKRVLRKTLIWLFMVILFFVSLFLAYLLIYFQSSFVFTYPYELECDSINEADYIYNNGSYNWEKYYKNNDFSDGFNKPINWITANEVIDELYQNINDNKNTYKENTLYYSFYQQLFNNNKLKQDFSYANPKTRIKNHCFCKNAYVDSRNNNYSSSELLDRIDNYYQVYLKSLLFGTANPDYSASSLIDNIKTDSSTFKFIFYNILNKFNNESISSPETQLYSSRLLTSIVEINDKKKSGYYSTNEAVVSAINSLESNNFLFRNMAKINITYFGSIFDSIKYIIPKNNIYDRIIIYDSNTNITFTNQFKAIIKEYSDYEEKYLSYLENTSNNENSNNINSYNNLRRSFSVKNLTFYYKNHTIELDYDKLIRYNITNITSFNLSYIDVCEDWNSKYFEYTISPVIFICVIVVINIILEHVVAYLTFFEKNKSFVEDKNSTIMKLFILLLTNTGVNLFFVTSRIDSIYNSNKTTETSQFFFFSWFYYDFSRDWFKNYSYIIVSIFFFTLFISQIVNYITMGCYYLIRYIDGRDGNIIGKGSERVAKGEFNNLYVSPEFRLEVKYGKILYIVAICFIFGGGMPILYIISLLYFIIGYWLEKILCKCSFY